MDKPRKQLQDRVRKLREHFQAGRTYSDPLPRGTSPATAFGEAEKRVEAELQQPEKARRTRSASQLSRRERIERIAKQYGITAETPTSQRKVFRYIREEIRQDYPEYADLSDETLNGDFRALGLKRIPPRK